MTSRATSAQLFVAAVAALVASASATRAEQVWFTQGVSVSAAERLRLNFSNTCYTEHGEHFANEEAANFRWRFADGWSIGPGVTFSQDHVVKGKPPLSNADDEENGGEGEVEEEAGGGRHHWRFSKRPTENLAVVWLGSSGGWDFSVTSRFDFYFREGMRDWIQYRNIAGVTAPAVAGIPWSPRPYIAQQVYFTGRDGYSGWERFSQFRWFAGLRLRPSETLFLSAAWQYRQIETAPDDWLSVRVVGISANLVF